MSAQDQARALMMRHHQMIKNRQQSMLNRAADEIGMDIGDCEANMQGKPNPSFRATYDRSNATMS